MPRLLKVKVGATMNLLSSIYNESNSVVQEYLCLEKNIVGSSNANDHIRTLLYNYEQRLCKGSSKLSDKILQCIPNCDFSCPSAYSYLNIMMKRLSTLFLSAKEKKFSFTFVREPLSRFISGMTEIEYRIQKNPSRQKYFEFKNELGSYQRFQEFVEFLLLHGDFRTFVDEHFNVEIAHIAPMIGTILRDPAIHLYRIEDFDTELRRLTQDVGQPDLYDLHVLFGKRNLAPHNSSHDEFNISITSKSFLAHASPAARSYLFPSSSSSSSSSSSASSEPLPIPAGEDPGEYQQLAAAYLVALCRIFLTDFLCAGGYELPQDCAFLRGEALELLDDFAGGAVANPSQCSDGRSDDEDPLCGLNVEQEVVEGCIPSSICDGQKCWEIFV
eukprot:gene25528-34085_t